MKIVCAPRLGRYGICKCTKRTKCPQVCKIQSLVSLSIGGVSVMRVISKSPILFKVREIGQSL